MTSPLTPRILASIRRALQGAVIPALRSVSFALAEDARRVDIWVVLDGGVSQREVDDLSAALAEVYADFAWPERGDPRIVEHYERVDAPELAPARGCSVYLRKPEEE